MCKLLLGISKTPNNEEFKKVIRTQYETMQNQPDGAAGLVITFDNKIHLIRDFLDYDRVFEGVDGLLDNARVVSLHTRIQTGGSVDQENVHYFESGGYLLAHNGTIPKFRPVYSLGYGHTKKNDWEKIDFELRIPEKKFLDEVKTCQGCGTTKDESQLCKKHRYQKLFNVVPDGMPLVVLNDDKKSKKGGESCPANPCDSHQFLINMPKPLTTEKLREFIKETEMNGAMVIVKKDDGRIWLVVKKEVLVLTDKKTFDVYTSFDPDVKVEKTVWVYRNGVPFIDKVQKISLAYKPKKVSQGTFEVDYLSKS